MYSIGIDIGTTTICGVLTSLTSKQIEKTLTYNNEYHLKKDKKSGYQDCNKILEKCKKIYDELTSDKYQIQSICFTGQMHGIVYVDKRGNAVSPLYSWQNKLGDEKYIDEKTYSQYLSGLGKGKVFSGYGLVTHFYNMKNGLIPKNSYKICTIADYVCMKFCGMSKPVIHYSNASSMGFFNLEKSCFDLPNEINNDSFNSYLPEVVTIPKKTGAYKGVKVYTAIGDNQASIYCNSQNEKGIFVNVGTGSQISCILSSLPKDVNISNLEIRPFLHNNFLVVGCALSGGLSYSLLKEFCKNFVSSFSEVLDGEIYDFLLKKAQETFDLGGTNIICNTSFIGSRYDENELGSFDNICSEQFNIGNISLSVLNGIANELYRFYLVMKRELRLENDVIIMSGNGLRKNELLQKIFEKTFNLNYKLSPYKEEAAVGCSLISIKY